MTIRPLNQSEKRVLTLLEENCRLPANQIAKKVRLSTEGVIKIIKRLEDANIVTRFSAKINYARIGLRIYSVHVKLLECNKDIRAQITITITEHKSCAWFTFCEGEYDLLLSFKISNEKDELDMHNFLTKISKFVQEKDVSIILHAFEIAKSFTTTDKSNTLFPIFNYESGKIVLTPKEREIVESIKSNARENILTLAKQVNITPRLYATKLRELQKKEVITGFKTRIDAAALDRQPCVALLTLNSHTPQDMTTFIDYCQRTPGIHYLITQLGKYDVKLTIDVEKVTDFYVLIDDLREKFSFVKKVTTLITKA